MPVPERIAVFDNDGALWSEQPAPVQLFFVADRVKVLAPQHPEWKTKEPFASILIIQYVSTFVPKMSGENFNPHVSAGVAPKDYLDKMLAEPFDSFTFSPASAAVYQLGPFGTTAKKLKEWDLKR